MNKEFIVHRKILFGDCDPAGVLYTPRIGYFAVEAVLDFLTECFGRSAEQSIMDLGILPPVRAFSVEFLKPMTWDDHLEITVRLKEIRTSAIAYSLNGFVQTEKVFSAELTQVCISAETRKPIEVPDKFREVLVNYGNT